MPAAHGASSRRAALTSAPHLGSGWIVLGIAVSLVVFGALGTIGVMRRAVD